jgi:hypothetical protein
MHLSLFSPRTRGNWCMCTKFAVHILARVFMFVLGVHVHVFAACTRTFTDLHTASLRCLMNHAS